ncbi:Phosphatidylinositol-4-phosphate 3-kinase c2 domain-containing subunit alpha [Dirofilaria immitis]|nr:Phosphatidylinositol-4-phosphate 3-kinase c2 domain-containing subunit alpha [Dirofilaria immitis]
MATNDYIYDRDLELALELSRQSYEEESRKRKENTYDQDLICWDDVEKMLRFKKLISLTNWQRPHYANVPTTSGSVGLYPYVKDVGGPENLPSLRYNDFRDTVLKMLSPSSSAVVVPFCSSINSLQTNNDLIDLSDKEPWEEFDPLSLTRSTRDHEASSTYNQNKDTAILQSKSDDSTLFYVHWNDLSPLHRGGSAPCKPPRSQKNGQDKFVNSIGPHKFDFDEIQLQEKPSEVDREIASLLRRSPQHCDPISKRFISPVVDYLITSFKVTSVKVIVEKDYSWPTILSADDRMTFTCETTSTIQYILANVLNTFLDPHKSVCYGVVCLLMNMIYGLDEFLLSSSQLGENPFVGQALAFGKDIRLEGLDVSSYPARSSATVRRRTISHIVLVSKKPDSVVRTMTNVREILDALKNSLRTYSVIHLNDDATKDKERVNQSVKLLCTILGRIMPTDLSGALRLFLAARTAEQLSVAVSELLTVVHSFLGTYCKSVRCGFDILPLKTFSNSEREQREILTVDEQLLVHVDSIHNIPREWSQQFNSFSVAVHIMHGTAEICRGFKENPRPIINDHFFPYCRTNTWACFRIPLCILPQETRIFILLYGTGHSTCCDVHSSNVSSESQALLEKQLACASFPLFDHEGLFSLLRQGSLLLPLSVISGKVVHPWGPRPLFETVDDLVVLVTLPLLHYDVIFPYVNYGENSLKRDFNSLDSDTQQNLLDIVESGVTHSLTEDEKETLWEKRHYLTQIPEALPLVLASAVGWDWASLTNIYQLLDDWMPLSSVQAIELLLPHFPDLTIRSKAILWLKNASSDFLFNFLPELVEALRFETFEDSSLAVYLLTLCAGDRRFAFELYWQLQQRIDQRQERSYSNRCSLLQQQVLKLLDEEFSIDIENQHRLLQALNAVSCELKDVGDATKMQLTLQRHLALLDARILENNVRLPLLPSFLCTGISVSESSYFNSLTKPIKVTFKGLKSSFAILYKVGDDMRQDALVLQLVKMMNDIWLSQELDLRMEWSNLFRIVVHYVKFKVPLVLLALENFHLSCAGWCVATYVLGIGDRHNDNILVTRTGHVFHIDFGKYMGDWQTAAGFRRDRTPFIFTSDMAYVINEGSPQSATSRYQHFVDNCCKAFNLLRKKYSILVNLMKMMSCSGIAGMNLEAVNFVQSNLLLNLTDTQATVQFTRMIEESLKSKFPRLNFLAHTLVQMKSTPSMLRGGYGDPNKLSFVQQLYTMKDDGRITRADVLAFEKWHIPEKMYKVEVNRENEAVCGIVYRSFVEFNELYIKLCRRFPFAHLPPLSQGTNVGRSNIRKVAERRQADLQQFLNVLFEYHLEVASSDLVYTFFHMIFRDSAPEESNQFLQVMKVNENDIPSKKVTGRIFLRLTYDQQEGDLNVFIGHVRGLKSLTVKHQILMSKREYLHPDPQRISKRKTHVVKNTQMPTFNEELNYQFLSDINLVDRALEISVWNCGSLVGENSVIGSVHIPLRKLLDTPMDRKGIKILDGWFTLSTGSRTFRLMLYRHQHTLRLIIPGPLFGTANAHSNFGFSPDKLPKLRSSY